jgi:Flp pilus assembly protein TadD
MKVTGTILMRGCTSHRIMNNGIRTRFIVSLAFITSVVFFSGCASMSVHREATVPIEQFQAYAGPDETLILPGSVDADIPDVEILSISSDMASAVDKTIVSAKNPKARLDVLVRYLLRTVRYDTVADDYGAKTARETFESGSGNCLSFSNLFVAMARYAGLNAKYQEIPTPPNWERDGEDLFFTKHIGASVDILERMQQTIILDLADKGQVLLLDSTNRYLFVPSVLDPFAPVIDLPSVSAISDQRAFAQYYNNLGSFHLAKGNGAEAFRYFVKAVKTDPALSFAWSNLGVVYSRNGQFKAAEAAFMQGLAVTRGARDVTALSIMNNMVGLYERDGDKERAAFYTNEVASFRRKNPYYQYALAKTAFHDTLYEQSVRYFKEAIRLKDNEHLFYYGLALAYDRLGDTKKAEKNIDKAKSCAFDEGKKLYYDQVRKEIVNGRVK